MQLTPPAQRVLGCLVEKALATPQQYPLTRNSLRTACNQTTGRDPVVEYDDNTVEDALAELRDPSLVRTEIVKGSRTPKYSHRLAEELELDQRDQAVLSLLLLRGPQTEGELRSRSDRLYTFSSLEEVDETLGSLAARGHVERLERRPGEKAERWRHRWGATGVASDAVSSPARGTDPAVVEAVTQDAPAAAPAPKAPGGDTAAVPELGEQVAALRSRVDALAREVDALRREVERGGRPAPGLP